MLVQIREFIERQQVVSTQQLTRQFKMTEHALEPILQVWVKKGVIQVCEEKTGCQSSCFKCKTTKPVYYQYNG